MLDFYVPQQKMTTGSKLLTELNIYLTGARMYVFQLLNITAFMFRGRLRPNISASRVLTGTLQNTRYQSHHQGARYIWHFFVLGRIKCGPEYACIFNYFFPYICMFTITFVLKNCYSITCLFIFSIIKILSYFIYVMLFQHIIKILWQ